MHVGIYFANCIRFGDQFWKYSSSFVATYILEDFSIFISKLYKGFEDLNLHK